MNASGNRVLSDGGPITLESGDISVAQDGQISADGVEVARIQVVEVDEPAKLQKEGDSEFFVPEGIELRAAVDFAIRGGYLETSNVDAVQEMVDMISSYRSYEADAQALKAQDESLEKLIANVGRTF